HFDRHQGAVGRAADDGLPAPGALRACAGPRTLSGAGRDHRSDRRPHDVRHARAAGRCAAERDPMKATRQLHDAGQSLWLDNITRSLLTGGTLSRYVGALSVPVITSSPTIVDTAL